MPVVSVVPSLMSSISIAISFDYSLFMLSRYEEELKKCEKEKKDMKKLLKQNKKLQILDNNNDTYLNLEHNNASIGVKLQMFIKNMGKNVLNYFKSLILCQRPLSENEKAVKTTLEEAGHVCFVSGVTLALTFLSGLSNLHFYLIPKQKFTQKFLFQFQLCQWK